MYTTLFPSIGVNVVVVGLTLTHNTMQSLVVGQAPITLEWKKYLGGKNNNQRIVHMIYLKHIYTSDKT